jgi:hypothetical protein
MAVLPMMMILKDLLFYVTQYSLLATSSSFCAHKNILNNRAWHLCDMHVEGPSAAM